MGHIKIATFALPHVRLPMIALPQLVYKTDEHHKEEYHEHDKLHARDNESMGSLTGIMSVMSSGKLTQQQVDIAQRIAVKVLAVLGIQESNKKQEKEE